jgi:DNA-binding winged helix-turn-helix (wHTH) protein
VFVRFGPFTLDTDRRQVLEGDRPVHLSRKAFDALAVLMERRPNAVTKEELHARLWPDTFVVDANLSVLVAEIRRALGDDAQTPTFIRTIHRIGYAFCGDSEGEPEPPRQSGLWLAWHDRAFALEEGDNVIGREPGCAIWLDAPGVSRRHACVSVRGARATIADLGSKNGTFVGSTPVREPHPLADGDLVRIGPVEVEFRQGGSRATETIRI